MSEAGRDTAWRWLVALAGQRLDYQPGEEIVAQGSPPDAVYIVLDSSAPSPPTTAPCSPVS